MWEDELLGRIASTSATNIEAGLRDRVRELRDRAMSCTHRHRAGHEAAVGVRWVSRATRRAR
jgi:hypothetical protein